jgi:bifunctional non-homologous end joining protein LigD
MLAQLSDDVPPGPGWRHEVKWDGFRTLARLADGGARLWSRRDQDLGGRFAEVARRLESGAIERDCVLDGEVCALDESGRPGFGLLQRGEGRLVYYVFDLLELEGEELCALPWSERRARLGELVPRGDETVRVSDAFDDGEALLAAARASGLEGIVSKRVDAPYRPGRRSPDWVKVKAHARQELVICGYTAGKGSRGSSIGALVLGYHRDGALVWAGNCGSGFTEEELRRLHRLLRERERATPPFDEPPRMPRVRRGDVRWVEPELVCEVEFAEWTSDGRLRAPVYQGLRDDKAPAEVTREEPAAAAPFEPPPAPAPAPAPPAPPSSDPPPPPDDPPSRRIRLSNLDKVFFAAEGITKGDLIDYYRRVAPVLVPHLRDRPFTMIRYPDGIEGEHFFQKDRPGHMPDFIPVAPLPASSDPSSRIIRYPLVNEPDALLWMANMGCIDMNAWYSRVDEPHRPDFVLFDLDPAEGSGFPEAAQVALLVRDALELLGLRGYPKTSSARGLHVMVPIERVHTYAEVRRFCSVVAGALERTHRGLVTTEWAKARRRGVLIDANQIGYGKTISSVYSVRPRPGAPVSTPLRWEEVTPELDPRRLTMAAALERIESHGDLFAPVLEGGQQLGPALARLS